MQEVRFACFICILILLIWDIDFRVLHSLGRRATRAGFGTSSQSYQTATDDEGASATRTKEQVPALPTMAGLTWDLSKVPSALRDIFGGSKSRIESLEAESRQNRQVISDTVCAGMKLEEQVEEIVDAVNSMMDDVDAIEDNIMAVSVKAEEAASRSDDALKKVTVELMLSQNVMRDMQAMLKQQQDTMKKMQVDAVLLETRLLNRIAFLERKEDTSIDVLSRGMDELDHRLDDVKQELTEQQSEGINVRENVGVLGKSVSYLQERVEALEEKQEQDSAELKAAADCVLKRVYDLEEDVVDLALYLNGEIEEVKKGAESAAEGVRDLQVDFHASKQQDKIVGAEMKKGMQFLQDKFHVLRDDVSVLELEQDEMAAAVQILAQQHIGTNEVQEGSLPELVPAEDWVEDADIPALSLDFDEEEYDLVAEESGGTA